MQNPIPTVQTLLGNKLRQELIVAISKSIQLNDDLIEINSLLEQVKAKMPGKFDVIAILTGLMDKFYKKQIKCQEAIDEIKDKMSK